MAKRNKFVYTVILIVSVFIFFCCDSYHSRKKLATELSLMFNNNREEFDKIHDFFLGDSLSKGLIFRYQDEKIGIGIGNNSFTIDSITQMKDNPDICQILVFMKKEKIRTISGNGKEGWITLAFEDNKFPCFDFWYRSDFNPDDENVKQAVENIKNTKTKNWIHILGDGWYIRGVKCF